MSAIVQFQVEFQTSYGEEIYLIGDLPELGNWDVTESIPLIWHEGNIWKKNVKISQKNASYKYLLKRGDEFIWEQGRNRTIVIEREQLQIRDDWNHQTLMIKVRNVPDETMCIKSDCPELSSEQFPMKQIKKQNGKATFSRQFSILLTTNQVSYQLSTDGSQHVIDFAPQLFKKNICKIVHGQKQVENGERKQQQLAFKQIDSQIFYGKFLIKGQSPKTAKDFQALKDEKIDIIVTFENFINQLQKDDDDFDYKQFDLNAQRSEELQQELKNLMIVKKKTKKNGKKKPNVNGNSFTMKKMYVIKVNEKPETLKQVIMNLLKELRDESEQTLEKQVQEGFDLPI